MSASLIEKLSLMLILGASILKYKDHTTLLEIETPFTDVSATAVVALQRRPRLPCLVHYDTPTLCPAPNNPEEHHITRADRLSCAEALHTPHHPASHYQGLFEDARGLYLTPTPVPQGKSHQTSARSR